MRFWTVWENWTSKWEPRRAVEYPSRLLSLASEKLIVGLHEAAGHTNTRNTTRFVISPPTIAQAPASNSASAIATHSAQDGGRDRTQLE